MVERLRESPLSAGTNTEFDLICLDRPHYSHWGLFGEKNFFRDLYF